MDDVNKEHFIGFCGTPFQYRIPFMECLEKNFDFKIKKDCFSLGEDMVRAVNSYKIHFNNSDNDDINFRVFETLGVKTMLFTSRNENVETWFDDMSDIVTYGSENEMIDKMKYIINNQDIIKNISENGYQKLIKHHTYDIRANQLIKIINEII
jgi:spore maturation protein CgeB